MIRRYPPSPTVKLLKQGSEVCNNIYTLSIL